MTTYGYARVSRGQVDGTETLQNQRVRLTGAGVDAANIHQDIITGTVIRRPGLNGLLEVIRAGEVLVVTALDRLGRDMLGLLRWSGRVSAGAGHAGARPGGGGGDQPTGAGGLERGWLKETLAGSAGLSHRLGYALSGVTRVSLHSPTPV